MKTKKIAFNFLRFIFTAGASLTLGFFSFGGMFAIWPIIPLALGSGILSVLYEGEVYWQNINDALNKLFFKKNFLQHRLADEYLDTIEKEPLAPTFLKDYQKLKHATISTKEKLKKELRTMKKWFSTQLFKQKSATKQTTTDSKYKQDLSNWLIKNNTAKHKNPQEDLNKIQHRFNLSKIFSLSAGFFMALGTSYLLVDVFTIIPFFTSISFTILPIITAPLAILAGIAYSLLTYNSLTEMILNKTLQKWYDEFKKSHGKLRSFIDIMLIGLAIILTICTAGTWWTIAQTSRSIFSWVDKLPRFVMGIISPIIIGASYLIFNLENTYKSLAIFTMASIDRFREKTEKTIKKTYKQLRKENILQILNPARLLLILIIIPLRIVLFICHLLCIGVTSDKVPGISEIIAAIPGMIGELLEDAHYFLPSHGHNHDSHGHNHDIDIPSRLISFICLPLYILAAIWDVLASQLNSVNTTKPQLTLKAAWYKQTTGKTHSDHAHTSCKSDLSTDSICLSNEWTNEKQIFLNPLKTNYNKVTSRPNLNKPLPHASNLHILFPKQEKHTVTTPVRHPDYIVTHEGSHQCGMK